jgi:ribosomal protein L11 methyltransferase
METHSLVEISLSGLDDETARLVTDLFDRWGRGGAVVEQIADGEGESRIKTYLLAEDDESLREIEVGLELLKRARPAAGYPVEPHIRFLAETDWAEAWKASYNVLRVGRRLVIKPTWHDYTSGPGELVIELDPGMAFGSGLHPTTRLCLEALEDHLHPGASVLDVGTGSGILAIAAARLGADHVLALDTDRVAVQVARDNVLLNHVESVVDVELGTIPIPADRTVRRCDFVHVPTADLVLANILAETIIQLAPAWATSLNPEGTLIASGIIAERGDAVMHSLIANGLRVVSQQADGDWLAFVARKATSNTRDIP